MGLRCSLISGVVVKVSRTSLRGPWFCDPRYGITLLTGHGWQGIAVLGGVFLAMTGGEAMYADMGHIGRNPIRTIWYGIVTGRAHSRATLGGVDLRDRLPFAQRAELTEQILNHFVDINTPQRLHRCGSVGCTVAVDLPRIGQRFGNLPSLCASAITFRTACGRRHCSRSPLACGRAPRNPRGPATPSCHPGYREW
jgi:hypothetical protein